VPGPGGVCGDYSKLWVGTVAGILNQCVYVMLRYVQCMYRAKMYTEKISETRKSAEQRRVLLLTGPTIRLYMYA